MTDRTGTTRPGGEGFPPGSQRGSGYPSAVPRSIRSVPRPGVPLALLALLVLVLAACARPPEPASFDPASPCTTDGQQPGAYPDLEALLPATFRGGQPQVRDSGRTCTEDGLGSLADAGIEELRFAGATWDLGGSQGVTYAVFDAPGLTPAAMIDFYERGAAASGRTDAMQVRPITLEGRDGERLDAINRNVGQTIVAWPAAEPDRVNVILTAALGEEELTAALAELAPG